MAISTTQNLFWTITSKYPADKLGIHWGIYFPAKVGGEIYSAIDSVPLGRVFWDYELQ